jgi:hypothetical protein
MFLVEEGIPLLFLTSVVFDSLAENPDCHVVISTIGRNLNGTQ